MGEDEGQPDTIPKKLSATFTAVRESIPVQVAGVAKGPFESFLGFTLHRLTGLPDSLDPYFDPVRPGESERDVSLAEVCQALGEVRARLKGENGVAEHFLNPSHKKFLSAKEKLQKEISSAGVLSDYVVSGKESFILFYQKDGLLKPVVVWPENCTKEKLQRQIAAQKISTPLGSGRGKIQEELAISDILTRLSLNPKEYNLDFISSIANRFSLRRHIVFERDGEMFESLTKRGAMSIGELAEAQRLLMTFGVNYGPKGVWLDPQLSAIWVKTRMMTGVSVEAAQRELAKYARETVYFEFVTQFLRENSQLVSKLLQSPLFGHFRDDFVDIHLAARGQTETSIAAAMIANYYLYKFEGSQNPQHSPSQAYLNNSEQFINAVGVFIKANSEIAPVVPDAARDGDQDRFLEQIFAQIAQNPMDRAGLDPLKKKTAIEAAEKSLVKAKFEMRRHEAGRKTFNKLKRLAPYYFIDDDEELQKPFRSIIASFALARVPGEGRPTMQSYFSRTGYFAEGAQPVPYEQENAQFKNVGDSIRYIFNGEVLEVDSGIASAYESQVSRIYTEGTTIAKFLMEDARVPENVREFIKILFSDQLAVKVLERFGSIADQDPEIVNKFFKDSFRKFQVMTQHRFITDFIRGVETRLIMMTGSPLDKLSRKTIGGWRNYDFSKVPQEILEEAIGQTLQNAEHRIKFLNHEFSEKRKTLKDRQEFVEKVLGWNTYDMWFLRWEKYWDVYKMLGGAWHCICFSRKPLFNVGTIQQY